MKKLILAICLTISSIALYAQEATTVIISEVCGSGSGVNGIRDFVELYNPTSNDIDLSGWSVKYKSATGSTFSGSVTIELGKKIKSHGFFLLGFVGNGALAPDAQGTFDISGSTTGGGHIALCSPSTTGPALYGFQNLVDLVGWGTGNMPEGGIGNAAPSHPALGGSLERKASIGSTTATMANGGADALKGNGYDTNNNRTDFVVRSISNPQNSSSPLEGPDYYIKFTDTYPKSSSVSAQSFDLNINADRIGKAYYAVVEDGEQPPMVSQIFAGQRFDGSAAISSGTLDIDAANIDYLKTVTNLQPGKSYDVYIVAENSYQRLQTSATKIDVQMEGTLPVTLSSFTAIVKQNAIEVNWRTLSEKNNSHFSLFASNDGKNWEEIKRIESKALNGASTVAIDYNLSIALSNISLAAFGFLSLLFMPSVRNRFARFAILLCLLTSFISCAKENQSSMELDIHGKGKQKTYLKLVQYDLNGTITELGVTSVTRTL